MEAIYKIKTLQNIQEQFLFLRHKFLDVLRGGVFDFGLLKSCLYYLKASVVKYLLGHWQLQGLTVQEEGHLMILVVDKGKQSEQQLCSQHMVQWLWVWVLPLMALAETLFVQLLLPVQHQQKQTDGWPSAVFLEAVAE